MYYIEKLIGVIILLIILLISINSSSNILLYINNNNVRFLMILFIIIIGQYDVKMAGLSGLLFLLLLNKANHIEGLENILDNKENKYAILKSWLYLMLIEPQSYISNDKNVVRNEIDKLKLGPFCKDFTVEYKKIMDDNLAITLLILIDSDMSDIKRNQANELNMIESYLSSEYNLKLLIQDLQKFLEENNKKIDEKEYLNNKSFVRMIKSRDIDIEYINNSLITKALIPFLNNLENEKCIYNLLKISVDNLKQKYKKYNKENKSEQNTIENKSEQNTIEKTPEQKNDDAKSAEVKASEAKILAEQKKAESKDAEYNAMKLKMYAESKWLEAKSSNAKKLAEEKDAEAKAAEAKANEAKVNEDKSNQAKDLSEVEHAKTKSVYKSLIDEAMRLKILALEAEEDAKVKAKAYDEYYNKKIDEKDRIVEAERQKAEQDRIAEGKKAKQDLIAEREERERREREESERRQRDGIGFRGREYFTNMLYN